MDFAVSEVVARNAAAIDKSTQSLIVVLDGEDLKE
jgi:hypothetical protein